MVKDSCTLDSVSKKAKTAGLGKRFSPLFDTRQTTARVLCPVLAPQHKKDIDKLEQVQWKTIKMVRQLECMSRG